MVWRGERYAPAPPAAVPALRDEHDVARAYDAHGAELHRFALRCTGDPGAAQDLVQETFLRAWRAADRYDPARASLRVWLFAIARNAVVDHARAAGARPWQSALPGEEAVAAAAAPAADPVEDLVRSWVLEEALGRLPEDQRTAIVETYLADRPQQEFAAERGIPVGTVRSRVFYGLRALREAMREMGVQP